MCDRVGGRATSLQPSIPPGLMIESNACDMMLPFAILEDVQKRGCIEGHSRLYIDLVCFADRGMTFDRTHTNVTSL